MFFDGCCFLEREIWSEWIEMIEMSLENQRKYRKKTLAFCGGFVRTHLLFDETKMAKLQLHHCLHTVDNVMTNYGGCAYPIPSMYGIF